jgi:rhodanese-related sulfurtransferase
MAKSSQFGSVLTVAVALLVGYLVYTYYVSPTRSEPSLRISINEAKGRRFGLIIDVRTPREREQLGYYPNSIPISIDMLDKEVPLDISNKNTHILIYSNGDDRAAKAANILYRMGYNNVRFISQTYLSLMPGSTY